MSSKEPKRKTANVLGTAGGEVVIPFATAVVPPTSVTRGSIPGQPTGVEHVGGGLAPRLLQHAQFLAAVGKAGDANFPLVASPRVEECQLSGAILGGHSRRKRQSVSPTPVHSG